MITDPNPGIHARIVPMSKVLSSDSVDSSYYGARCAGDVVKHKRLDDGYTDLLNSIKEHGFDPQFAPAWDTWDGVREGHHRIAALIDLGAKWCPVQRDTKRGKYFELPDGTRPAACAHHGSNGCPDGPWQGGCWFENEDEDWAL